MRSAWEPELRIAADAAAAAAGVLEGFRAEPGVSSEAGRDIKTAADLAAEAVISQQLEISGIPVLGEESAEPGVSLAEGTRWIVDPLDGTLNFVRGIPVCAVSIGLWDRGRPVLGVIRDLGQRVEYRGVVGSGAWRDGVSIKASEVAEVDKAVMATGFPTHRDFSKSSLANFIDHVRRFKKIRLLGSAAVSMAYVAAGIVDAYAEDGIMIWDIAAGAAIVEAAGGSCSIQQTPGTYRCLTVATNGCLPLAFGEDEDRARERRREGL